MFKENQPSDKENNGENHGNIFMSSSAYSEYFDTYTGVKQGETLSPLLFIMFIMICMTICTLTILTLLILMK